MLIYFWRDWLRIIGGFFSSIRDREVKTVDQKMAWMIILATIPVGLVGLKFEHTFRVIFGKPIRAAIFLMVNGVILFAGERFRTRKSLAAEAELAAEADPAGGRAARRAPAAAPSTAVAGAAVAAAAGAAGPGGTASGAAAMPGGPAAPAMHASGQRAERQLEIGPGLRRPTPGCQRSATGRHC